MGCQDDEGQTGDGWIKNHLGRYTPDVSGRMFQKDVTMEGGGPDHMKDG